MKALVYTGPYALEWRDMPTPTPAKGELLIRPRAVSICGSDLNGYRGNNSMRVPPLVMGHEFAGEVVESGPETSLAAGTRVAVNPCLNCGVCENCRQGRPNLCDYRTTIGTSMPAGSRDGAMAEYVVVPERAAMCLPDTVDYAEAAVLEPLAVALHAVKKAGALQGKTVAVIGAGPIGLLVLLCLTAQQPAMAACIDLSAHRRSKALECGATLALDSADAVACLRHKTQSHGVDVVIDAVGVEATMSQAMQLVRNGGQIVMVGMGAEYIRLHAKALAAHEVQMCGSYTYVSEMHEGLALLPQLQVGRILTARYPMEQGARAFEAMTAPDPPDIKIILTNS